MNYFQERQLKADINISAAGDNIIIAPGMTAPAVQGMPLAWENAGEFLAIDFITVFPSSAVVLQLKDGADNYGGAYSLAAQQPFAFDNADHDDNGIIRLSPNRNLVINLGAPVQVSGFVKFRRKQSN